MLTVTYLKSFLGRRKPERDLSGFAAVLGVLHTDMTLEPELNYLTMSTEKCLSRGSSKITCGTLL